MKTLAEYMEELNPTPKEKTITQIVWNNNRETLIFNIRPGNVYEVSHKELIEWIEKNGVASELT